MKLCLTTAICFCCSYLMAQHKNQFNDTSLMQPIEINAIRANEKSPFAKNNISKKEIVNNNVGVDLPFLLNQIPAVVINSDAGTGIGYTGIKIRGSDASRINVTLNGIPYNDAESQATYFVDLPDFLSSTNSIQVQRGIGTSTNGAGAFGASINLSSNDINKNKYAELNNSFGSFNSIKNNLQFGTGLLNSHFTIDGRISKINSNGYIDRAASNLKSLYFSTAYINNKNSLRLNIFSGKEKTYQAWNGVPESLLLVNPTYNSAGTEKPGEPYNNEIDNYTQTHYQLFYNHQLKSYLKGNIAIFYTKGKGYYEQYKANQQLLDYRLPNYFDGTNYISNTDLIRRLWLDNNFYGTIFSLQYQKLKTNIVIGGGITNYDGEHYGQIIWSKVQNAIPYNYKWYNLNANKKDNSIYSKWSQQLNNHLQSFVDLQLRNVNYLINGFKDNPNLTIHKNYNFINPKFGFTYNKKNILAYFSYAIAQHEPNRDDYEASVTQQPKPELLNDFEIGIETNKNNYFLSANVYLMQYKNQLILTGKINDVGAYTRTNIDKSYRAGIELQAKYKFDSKLNVNANIAFSQNKIKNYTEFLDDYDNGGQKNNFYPSTTISFSPSIVSSTSINYTPLKNAQISLISKYVSRQFLDNTSLNSRSLNSFYVHDIHFSYLLIKPFKLTKEINFIVQIKNIFSKKYQPNGYSFSYIYGGATTTENFYFPMAPINFLTGINISF